MSLCLRQLSEHTNDDLYTFRLIICSPALRKLNAYLRVSVTLL
jgi:hypothetical protein